MFLLGNIFSIFFPFCCNWFERGLAAKVCQNDGSSLWVILWHRQVVTNFTCFNKEVEFSWLRFKFLDQFLYYSVPSLKPWDNRCTTGEKKTEHKWLLQSCRELVSSLGLNWQKPIDDGVQLFPLLSCSSSPCESIFLEPMSFQGSCRGSEGTWWCCINMRWVFL